MNNENTFEKGQGVWVKARLASNTIDDNGEIAIYVNREWDANYVYSVLPCEIRTTEQILKKHGALAPLKYEYTMTLNGDFAIYQVIKYTATEDEAMKELNRLNREASHFTPEIPQNAELAEPDHTRKFQKGDKVQIVERDGRTPWLNDGFILNGYYTVCENEDINGDVCLHDETRCEFFAISWFFLDLVETAPEPKYWLHESPKTYSIYYKGQFGRVITAMLMQKDLYTLEEAQEQCDKLNRKEQDND